MSQKSHQKHEARKELEAKKAEKVIRNVFLGLIILAIISMVCFSIWG